MFHDRAARGSACIRHEPEEKGGALPLRAHDADAPAKPLHDPVDDREAKARALDTLGRKERVEDLVVQARRDPPSRVADPEFDPLPAHRIGHRRPDETQRAALGHRIHGVQDQVGDGLPDLRLRPEHRRQDPDLPDRVDGAPLLGGSILPTVTAELQGLQDQLGEVAAGQLCRRVLARETLDPSDHIHRVGGGLEKDAGCLLGLLVRHAVEDHLGAGRDDGEEIVQIVGHPRRKFPEGAKFLGPDQFLLHQFAQLDVGTQLFVHPALLDGDCHVGRQRLEIALCSELVVVRGCGTEGEDAQDPFRGANRETEDAGKPQHRILGARAVAGILSAVPRKHWLPRAKCDARQAVGDVHEVFELDAGEAQECPGL